MKHLVELQSLPLATIHHLFQRADELSKTTVIELEKILAGKRIGMLFYEPSTRTRWSFESAGMILGGKIIGTENAREFSSAAKGESLEDTIRVVGSYVDGIVMRHYEEGAAERAKNVSDVPIINAGDGPGQHPSQALLDLYTIQKEIGRVEDFTIAMVGDLKNGRTVRSLCYLLGKFKKIEIIFIAPPSLAMRDDIKEYLGRHKVRFEEQNDLNAQLPKVDIVYMTRIQKERMSGEEADMNNTFSIDEDSLSLMRNDARLLHPLPHLEEINLPIAREKTDSRVAYFRQAKNGVGIRMAILESVLSK